MAQRALDSLEVDHAGLDRMDRNILRAIIDKFGGGPVGLDTVAVAVSEEADTVQDVYEPFLIKAGLLARTPRGRVATAAAWAHFGKTPPKPAAKELPLFDTGSVV